MNQTRVKDSLPRKIPDMHGGRGLGSSLRNREMGVRLASEQYTLNHVLNRLDDVGPSITC